MLVLWALLLLWVPGVGSAQGVGAFVSPGPLSLAHADLDGITSCTQCHAPGQGTTPARCMACHEEIEAEVNAGTGFHGDKRRCKDCHPEHRGRDFDIAVVDESSMDHDSTGFPLRGRHAKTGCDSCHIGDGYGGVDPSCLNCHDDVHGAAASRRQLLDRCDTCHRPGIRGWAYQEVERSMFDHSSSKHADYPLEGGHIEVPCLSCHIDAVFVPLAHTRCDSCHTDPHRKPLGSRCEECHETPQSWRVDDFNHSRTNYKLRGRHRRVPCEGCHSQHKTDPVRHGTCAACHADPHAGQFAPRGCDDCHTLSQAGFALREFDHDQTPFPLIGAHVPLTCEDCHGDGEQAQYASLRATDCSACHSDAHAGRYSPAKCATCHTPDGWNERFFDHSNTRFPHTGKHVGLACEKCHTEGSWTGLVSESCEDCHFEKNPHGNAIERDACDGCHATTSFAEISFDHAAGTKFDPAPAHVDVPCTRCHKKVAHFEGLSTVCSNCHVSDRPIGHYGGECDGCHQAAHWVPGGLGDVSHAVTGFPLAGAHAQQPCASCHRPGRLRGEVVGDCSACHAADDPHRHTLGDTCSDCHSDHSWFRTSFRHGSTGWPLRGAHRLAACPDCHPARTIGTPTDCWRCHEAQAPRTIAAHRSPAFALCDTCHRSFTWAPYRFPH